MKLSEEQLNLFHVLKRQIQITSARLESLTADFKVELFEAFHEAGVPLESGICDKCGEILAPNTECGTCKK